MKTAEEMLANPWVGFDFDGTLVTHIDTYYPGVYGNPVPSMLSLVRKYLAMGATVKIFTARVSTPEHSADLAAIKAFCVEHFGTELEVTCVKDLGCKAIYDDLAYNVYDGVIAGDVEHPIFPDL